MHHHAVADFGFRRGDPGADRNDDAAGLVPGNDGIGAGRYAGACPRQVLRAAVLISSTTSPGPGVGSGKVMISTARSPGNTTPRMASSTLLFVATESIEVCHRSLP
jgi:hypothetical protein